MFWRVDRSSPGLHLDRYHIDSLFIAHRSGREAVATFDLYSRRPPFRGGYLLAAGLEHALAFARDLSFSEDDIAYLRSIGPYDDGFLRALRDVRFTGDIAAMPEGTIAFGDEPLLRVTAPFPEALLLESAFLHFVSLNTLIATKTARVVCAAAGRPVSEFSFRRAQDPFTVSRAAWIAGAGSTSFLAAAKHMDLPPTGTIPHALVQAFPSEEEAFRAVAETLPRYTLLVDTYDVDEAIARAVEVARDVRERLGHELVAVRIDSGDLAAYARLCRPVLDDGGFGETKIIASGDLDEFGIQDLVASGAPIDAFGVGTAIGGGIGSPERGVPGGHLNSVYKLVWYDGRPVVKEAAQKGTWPGLKQVHRVGGFEEDVIALETEPAPPRSQPLLERVMAGGELLRDPPPLAELRERAHDQLARLPERYRTLLDPPGYPVRRSEGSIALRDRAVAGAG